MHVILLQHRRTTSRPIKWLLALAKNSFISNEPHGYVCIKPVLHSISKVRLIVPLVNNLI